MSGVLALVALGVCIAAACQVVFRWEKRQAIDWDGLRLTNDADVIDAAALPLSESEAACRIRAEILASEASRYLREAS